MPDQIKPSIVQFDYKRIIRTFGEKTPLAKVQMNLDAKKGQNYHQDYVIQS